MEKGVLGGRPGGTDPAAGATHHVASRRFANHRSGAAGVSRRRYRRPRGWRVANIARARACRRSESHIWAACPRELAPVGRCRPTRRPRSRPGAGRISTPPASQSRRGAANRSQTPPMSAISEAAVLDALRTVQEPELGGNLVTRGMVKDLVIDGSDVAFTIELTTPACPLKDEIEVDVRRVLAAVGVEGIAVTWSASVRRATPRAAEQIVPGVKNIIAVASGKGGVGKSTVSVNLAVALARSGASVGLLDADITGPNIPMMLGVEGQPTSSANNKIIPLERYGVKVISIQFFVPEGQPIVWR